MRFKMTVIDSYCVMGLGSGPGPAPEDELLGLINACGVGMAVLHPPDGCYAFYNEEGNERLINWMPSLKNSPSTAPKRRFISTRATTAAGRLPG